MTELCRAALWYSNDIEIIDTKLHGIKALRECGKMKMKGCDITRIWMVCTGYKDEELYSTR